MVQTIITSSLFPWQRYIKSLLLSQHACHTSSAGRVSTNNCEFRWEGLNATEEDANHLPIITLKRTVSQKLVIS